jgi:hypothetical protein
VHTTVSFAVGISSCPQAAAGRRRVYTKTISMPQTCRSNWHVTQPTIGADTSGHQATFATDSFMESHRGIPVPLAMN